MLQIWVVVCARTVYISFESKKIVLMSKVKKDITVVSEIETSENTASLIGINVKVALIVQHILLPKEDSTLRLLLFAGTFFSELLIW